MKVVNKSKNPTTRVYQQMLAEAEKRDAVGKNSANSLSWYMARTQKLSKREYITVESTVGTRKKWKRSPDPGQMFFFRYEPKHAETLPYYDVFPLVVVIDSDSKGFTGLNFHYLSSIPRSILFDGLTATTNNKLYDNTTRMILTYKYLNSVSKFKYFKPCFKQYLYSHVKSPFVEVSPKEWPIALFLPVESFRKKGKRQVWLDSMKKVK